MSAYKSEIGNLKEGRQFYFPNDFEKKIWTITDSTREASNKAKFIYCQANENEIQDFNSNRTVMALWPGSEVEEKIIPEEKLIIKKETLSYMTHNESSVKVNHTKDFAKFRMITGNRQLNQLKIKRILKDISEGLNVLKYCPVLVKECDDKLEIIDGQHRFYVSRKLKCGVWYIVCDSLSLIDIAKINSNTDKWKDTDFINCYVQQGNENYIALQSFIDEYGFPIGISLIMLSKGKLVGEGGGTGVYKHKFRTGEFEVNHLEKAKVLAQKIKQFSVFPGHTSGGFAEAISRIISAEKIKLEDLLEKFSKDPLQLTSKKNAKEYLNALEIVYNQNARVRKIIY